VREIQSGRECGVNREKKGKRVKKAISGISVVVRALPSLNSDFKNRGKVNVGELGEACEGAAKHECVLKMGYGESVFCSGLGWGSPTDT